jgi:hypothetical protein
MQYIWVTSLMSVSGRNFTCRGAKQKAVRGVLLIILRWRGIFTKPNILQCRVTFEQKNWRAANAGLSIKKTPMTRRCTNIWFDFFGTTGISGTHRKEMQRRYSTGHTYMCAMLLLTRNPQIKLLSHDFLSHAWTKLFQTNWYGRESIPHKSYKKWMWAVYLYHVPFFLEFKPTRWPTSNDLRWFPCVCWTYWILEFLLYRRRMNTTEGDKSGVF